ncbi:MAG: glutathione transferase GstA [Erythrobacter sp.]
MKLYYVPGACSAASHIMLRETGQDFELEPVNVETGLTERGREFRSINAKGKVPVLELENGERLSEGAAVLQFIADSAPDKTYAPALGTIERARLQEHLNWTSSELHKAFSPLFADPSETTITASRKLIEEKFSYIEGELGDGREFLVGDTFSAADAYLFVVANWANFKDIDLAPWPKLKAYVERISTRNSVVGAFRAEGIA